MNMFRKTKALAAGRIAICISHLNFVSHTASYMHTITNHLKWKLILGAGCGGRLDSHRPPEQEPTIPGAYELDRVKYRKENIAGTRYIHGETLRCMGKSERLAHVYTLPHRGMPMCNMPSLFTAMVTYICTKPRRYSS